MAIELYPHNKKTYKKMTTMFKKGNRVGIVQPTGTGKSFIVLKWIEDHPHDKFVVLSPSLEIFMQFVGYAKETGDEALLDNAQMLSYQTLIKMSDEEIAGTHAQKIVVDEFHRTGAFQWGPAFLKLLDANPDAKVLGTSATPVRYLDGLRDMASELFDNNLAIEMTLGEAVRKGILPTPRIIEVLYNMDEVMSMLKSDIAKESNIKKRHEAERLLAQMKRHLEEADGAEVIFQKYMPHNHGKFIVFCRNKEHLKEMEKTVPKWLRRVNKKVRSYVSIADQADKDIQLWAFVSDNSRDSIKLLFTIDRLNEGLHVKGIDGVIMLRPTESPIIYLQQMGRALTAHNKTCNKSPIIFDMVNNYENVKVRMPNGEMRNVIEVQFLETGGRESDIPRMRVAGAVKDFNQLMRQMDSLLYPSYDAVWEKHFIAYVAYKKKFGREPNQQADYSGIKLGKWCSHQRQSFKNRTLSDERIKRLQAEGFVFNAFDETWERNFEAYVAYKKEFDKEPDWKTLYDGIKLSVWIAAQRENFKKNILAPERIERLRAEGFVFEPYEESWEQNFEAYVAYKKEFGKEPDCMVVYNGLNLGAWCKNQRLRFKKDTLSDEKIKRLQAAGFVYNVIGEAWEQGFEAYVAYKKEFGKEPTQRAVYKGLNLGMWCCTQRRSFKKETLSAEKIERLLAEGFVFDTFDETWERNFEAYVAYKQKFDKEPTAKTVYKDLNLGMWCCTQRRRIKKGTLSAEKIERLRAVGFLLDSRTTLEYQEWRRKFNLYVEYKKLFSKEPARETIYGGTCLFSWCANQRTNFKNGTLSAEQIEYLQAAGFVFDALRERWEQGFETYVSYKQEYGKEPTYRTVYNGINLGKWCSWQKKAYRNNKLSDDKIQKLREAGFPF